MNLQSIKIVTALLAVLVSIPGLRAQEVSDTTATRQIGEHLLYSATIYAGGATKEFNPYMLGAWRYGRTPMGGEALMDLAVEKPLDKSKRFSWAAAAEMVTGWSRKATYQRYAAADGGFCWQDNRQGMAAAWIQQLYAMVKYRGVFLNVGMREETSPLVDGTLSSGDLIHSNNARPVAQIQAGFIDYQNIPFTRGWVQIEGLIGFGKMADTDWLRNHYNYYYNHITLGSYYNYQRVYFRSNPTKPFSVAIGTQATGFFGGTTYWYLYGEEVKRVKNPAGFKAIKSMLIPTGGSDDGFMEGSHLGSWDFKASYRFRGGHEVKAYFQWLWEDGSSMGRRNNWDGLWGLEYSRSDGRRHLLEAALVEYIDFRNQSGPLHFAPGDYPGTDITSEATGGDNYYNNSASNAYMNRGLCMGTAFLVSPIYNVDGFPQFKYTRSNGFHAAARGNLCNRVDWRLAVSYAMSRGNGRWMLNNALHNTSAMAEAMWDACGILPGMSAGVALAFDAGSLRGNNFGTLVTIRYAGALSLQKGGKK